MTDFVIAVDPGDKHNGVAYSALDGSWSAEQVDGQVALLETVETKLRRLADRIQIVLVIEDKLTCSQDIAAYSILSVWTTRRTALDAESEKLYLNSERISALAAASTVGVEDVTMLMTQNATEATLRDGRKFKRGIAKAKLEDGGKMDPSGLELGDLLSKERLWTPMGACVSAVGRKSLSFSPSITWGEAGIVIGKKSVLGGFIHGLSGKVFRVATKSCVLTAILLSPSQVAALIGKEADSKLFVTLVIEEFRLFACFRTRQGRRRTTTCKLHK